MLIFGDIGADVCLWQQFLIGQGFAMPQFGADGSFGNECGQATRAFQARHGIAASGILDDATEDAAETLGFVPQDRGAPPIPTDPASLLPTFPPRPDTLTAPSVRDQQERLGPIEFRMANDPAQPEQIVITNGFEQDKIVSVRVPQFANLTDAPRSLNVSWNRLAVPQLLGLWAAWEAAGLLSRVKTWAGSFEPRCVRGQIGTLSNHAFGGAFDINDQWNDLSAVPALVGARGCVRELVTIANRFGFFWGGHYHDRLDGMHFEVARVMTQAEVDAEQNGTDKVAMIVAPVARVFPAGASAPIYRPNPASLNLLGAIMDLLPRITPFEQSFVIQPKQQGTLPDGTLYFDSELQLDTDGSPELAGDATHQGDTSLQYKGGLSINANRVPYFVLPLPVSFPKQFGIALGDFAAVISGTKLAFAVFADFGPKNKIGEGSVELFRQLGEERVRPDGSVKDFGMGPGVITIVFPGSGAAADRKDETSMLAALAKRGPALFKKLGGILPTA